MLLALVVYFLRIWGGLGGRCRIYSLVNVNIRPPPPRTPTPTTRSFLLWSDVKKNRIYRWEEGGGLFTIGKSVYLEPSGCRSNETLCQSLVEPGMCMRIMCVAVGVRWRYWCLGVGSCIEADDISCVRDIDTLDDTTFSPAGANGLATEPGSGLLVMCEHGERRVSRYIPMPMRWPFVCYAILHIDFMIVRCT